MLSINYLIYHSYILEEETDLEKAVPPHKHIHVCRVLDTGSYINVTVKSTNKINIYLLNFENYKLYNNNKSFTSEYSVLQTQAVSFQYNITLFNNYCIILENPQATSINISYEIVFAKSVIKERGSSIVSVIGIVLVITGIIYGFRGYVREKNREFPDTLKEGNIICMAKSLNKHSCIIEFSAAKYDVLELLIKIFTRHGYNMKHSLEGNYALLERRGKVFSRNFSEKPRTVLISIKDHVIELDYIINSMLASGTINLQGVMDEVKTITMELKTRYKL
ncbi:MAG: hypothetical protein J7K21_01955 [Desulfurococcales archaeon]|nr:hypothetical protein [Desulfurococcales archaeon]